VTPPVHSPGRHPPGTKTEVKNMNSFANVERALEAERARQVALVEAGERLHQVTLLFNAGTGQVKPIRSKEESHDYRYFPDPDLPPLVLAPAWIAEQRAALPELPDARRSRLETSLGIPAYDARVITSEAPLAEYFEAVVAAGVEPKTAANWIMGDVMTTFNEAGEFPVSPARLAALVGLVRDGVVSHQAAKRVYAEMAQSADGDPRSVAERLGLVQVSDQAPGRLGGRGPFRSSSRSGPIPRRRDQADGFLRRSGDEAKPGQGGSQGRPAGAAGQAQVGRYRATAIAASEKSNRPVTARPAAAPRARSACASAILAWRSCSARPGPMPWASAHHHGRTQHGDADPHATPTPARRAQEPGPSRHHELGRRPPGPPVEPESQIRVPIASRQDRHDAPALQQP
jgi:hypothetical protein